MIDVETTPIEGLLIITPKIFGDNRGYFMEAYNKEEFDSKGIKYNFIQDNISKSSFGVLRGLHFQKTYSQAKLVSVFEGEVFDVAVDLRKCSKTYGKWFGVKLDGTSKKMLMIPRGFAHGFVVLSETATFTYKVDNFYRPDDEGGIRYDDPLIGVDWPISKDLMKLSEKDKNRDYLDSLDFEF